MKAALCILLFTVLLCLLAPISIMAQEGYIYVYGFSGITYDEVNGVARGTSYTEMDYNTEAYYTPYVCGELHTDGVQRVRACRGGLHRATIYTSYTSNPNTIYLLSDHYVDITYQDDPYTSYIDYYGYGFLLSSNYPTSYYYYPPEIYNSMYEESIYLGSTNVSLQRNTCGDVRDEIVALYRNPTYGPPAAVPPCRVFVDNINPVQHFTFEELNVNQPYPWAIISGALKDFLEGVRENNGNVALRVTSGYRNPAFNYYLDPQGATNSQHIYGYAADLQTFSNWNQTAWGNLRVAALNAFEGCCEPLYLSGYSHVHVDWRFANPWFRPPCPLDWRTP